MILALKRTPGIYLIGFMGSGKSTIGKLLAEELGWSFLDLDELIEQTSGLTIPQLFEAKGEQEFRRIEHEALTRATHQIECGKPHIVALGGGAFVQEKNQKHLSDKGISIWLDCPLETLERRVARNSHRPLARDPEKFRELFRARLPEYSKADYKVEVNDADPVNHVRSILKLPLFS